MEWLSLLLFALVVSALLAGYPVAFTLAGVSLIFALYGAIDVAITQLMVETLVVVIIAVALLKLPPITLRREASAAIAEGATIVRIGTAIFGPRE